MVNRHFRIALIEKAWRRRSVVWLFGVRRAGKTYLCRNLQGVDYFDCELPRARRMIEDDPESFWDDIKGIMGIRGKRIILVEIHLISRRSSENHPPMPPLEQRGGFLFPFVKPLFHGGSSETISAPKVYAFDTGFDYYPINISS